MFRLITLALILVGSFVSCLVADNAAPSFETEIAPLIAKRCVECHNADDLSGGLDLSTAAGLKQGGESGSVIEPGNTDESYLLTRVLAGEMPPKSRGRSQKLPAGEIDLLRRWIESGAKWPAERTLDLYEATTNVRGGRDWWSLQPVVRPQIPRVTTKRRGANKIDAFVLFRLESEKLQPAPRASRRELIRRATFDLTGLPPTFAEFNAFISDPRPDEVAFGAVVDRLLSSQHYGERWARHWLDAIRFAETSGYERDQLKPNMWKFRDWVIDALNKDMPYSQFVTHQLAGDEIEHRDEASVIATGMIRAGTWNDEPNEPKDYVYDRLADMVHVTSSAFLGLTVKCARCHDHKFDPIRQEDYYRLAGFFWPGYIGQENLGGPNKDQLGFDVCGWTDRTRTAEPLHLLINGERGNPGPEVPPGFLSPVPHLDRPLREPPANAETTHRRLQLAEWMTEASNPLTPRVIVNRLWQHHFGAGLVRTPNNFGFKGDPPTHPQLLDWLAAELIECNWKLKPLHRQIMMSLTYRQSVNHPQYNAYARKDFNNKLLWRANRRRLDAESLRDALLCASGQLNKEMGGPSFYPKMSQEALEGLSQKENAWGQSSAEQRRRRSIYMITKRSRILPLMTTFDFCDTTQPCGQRNVTTVAPQALAMLNNDFVHQQSAALARRVVETAGHDPRMQIKKIFEFALGRHPSSTETRLAVAHLQEQNDHFRLHAAHQQDEKTTANETSGELALASLCHVILNTNEFIFVD